MAPNIVLARDFSIDRVTFSDMKVLDNGGKIVYVSYDRSPFFLQTPPMAVPFGLSKWDNDGKSPAKYSIDLSFKGMDSSKPLSAFHSALSTLDDKLIETGFDKQQSWFKGKRYGSREIVEALYTPMVKYAKDKVTGERTDAYPPTVKVTVPHRDGSFTCDVFDANRNSADLVSIETKGSSITAIIQCTGIWFAGGKFGLSWRVVQMKVVPSSGKIRGFALKEDEGGDDVADGAPTEVVDCPSTLNVCVASSSDDEEDEL
jgi:hypothetical protein